MDQQPVQIGQYILGKNLGIGAFGKVNSCGMSKILPRPSPFWQPFSCFVLHFRVLSLTVGGACGIEVCNSSNQQILEISKQLLNNSITTVTFPFQIAANF